METFILGIPRELSPRKRITKMSILTTLGFCQDKYEASMMCQRECNGVRGRRGKVPFASPFRILTSSTSGGADIDVYVCVALTP